MTSCSLTEGQTNCFRQGRQKPPTILMGGKLWTCVVASVSALLLHLSTFLDFPKGNLLINWWTKTCSTPQLKCHTPKLTLFWHARLSGSRQVWKMKRITLSLFLYLSQLFSIFSHLLVLSTSVCFCCLEKKKPKWREFSLCLHIWQEISVKKLKKLFLFYRFKAIELL